MAIPIKHDHDQRVVNVAKHLKQRFYRDIRARVAGFGSPEELPNDSGHPGHIPDVTMMATGEQLHILEIETAESLFDRARDEKWAAFAKHAGKQKGTFWLVVPQGLRPSAESRLEELNLEANVWEM